ncbi:MAG: hypothetical protein IKF71_05050, partial [Bacilli bacterium]|nr:hypothetical protein [Bacilli bacterium]
MKENNTNITENQNELKNINQQELVDYKKKKEIGALIVLGIIVALGIGYALLQTTLSISGATKVGDMTWNIYWDNIDVTAGSVEGTPELSSNDTIVSFEITLEKPGDFYEFTLDAVNDGSIDAIIDSVEKKVDGSTSIPNYLNYTVTYSDDSPISTSQMLNAHSSETYKVRVDFKKDVNETTLPSIAQTHTLTFEVNYVQATPSTTTSSSPSPSPSPS